MLTAPQLLALKAAILASTAPAVVAALANGSPGLVAIEFNQPSAPAVIVWRTRVNQDEIMQNGFDWTRVDNLSVGKARIWEWLFDNADSVFNPSKANVRSGIDAVWVGTAADLVVRAAVYVHCKRTATFAEALFASGAGTTASPSTMAWEGYVSEVDVIQALES